MTQSQYRGCLVALGVAGVILAVLLLAYLSSSH